eukprot:TRINITY_DN5350_c0_g1_i2.p1 TRINITY_DN5350_c0_g1~~TRINITY_DN5350_c0_g1_i2.p1  ORF type:complete len:179 (+),score=35.65 TRINITY_DN5350_c0_g1_i2:361-897(+)
MDHHCPWINNCVGAHNIKYFLIFLFYASLSCLSSVAVVSWRMWVSLGVRRGNVLYIAPLDALLYGFSLIFVLPAFFGVTGLMAWQLWIIATNTTTLEYYDNQRREHRASQKGKAYRNPYDLGLVENFRSVVVGGDNFLTLLSPFTPANTDPRFGVDFKTNMANLEFDEELNAYVSRLA